MKPTFFKGAVAGGIAGALCAAATVALAGTGINGIFNLGVDNSVDGQTQLRGNTGGNPQLRVNNQQGTDGAIGVLRERTRPRRRRRRRPGRDRLDRGQRDRRVRADHVRERSHQLRRRQRASAARSGVGVRGRAERQLGREGNRRQRRVRRLGHRHRRTSSAGVLGRSPGDRTPACGRLRTARAPTGPGCAESAAMGASSSSTTRQPGPEWSARDGRRPRRPGRGRAPAGHGWARESAATVAAFSSASRRDRYRSRRQGHRRRHGRARTGRSRRGRLRGIGGRSASTGRRPQHGHGVAAHGDAGQRNGGGWVQAIAVIRLESARRAASRPLVPSRALRVRRTAGSRRPAVVGLWGSTSDRISDRLLLVTAFRTRSGRNRCERRPMPARRGQLARTEVATNVVYVYVL